MQYVFFEESRPIRSKAPEAGEFARMFLLKVTFSNLTVWKVTFNCKLQKKLGEQDVLVAPPVISLGEQVLSLVLAHMRMSVNKSE